MSILRGKSAIFYIFFEMIPSFIMGIFVFVFIILMFQGLRLTEFALIHGVSWKTIGEILTYMTISFVPAILPMSLLFSILLTYGRLSSDSEILAFKSIGLSMSSLTTPAVLLSFIVAAFSAETTFKLAPWGNRQFEVLMEKLSQTKGAAVIREGTFSEGFFDLVVYANKVDEKTGLLDHVFIYDERDQSMPITIIAKSGQLVQDPLIPGHNALLRLKNGDIHRKAETHTKIHFGSYDIKLSEQIKESSKDKSPPSYTLEEINEGLKNPNTPPELKSIFISEFHKRWAISIACIIFGLLGVGLGTTTNRRTGGSGGLVVCIVLIILYWILYVATESAVKSNQLPVGISSWLPNLIFGISSFWSLKRVWR